MLKNLEQKLMKVRKFDSSGCWYSFDVDDVNIKFRVRQPKCRCMSCEYLNIEVEDDDGTRNYDVFPYDNGDQRIDDLVDLLCKLCDYVGEKALI